jgi:hypothetical protein
MKRKVKAVASNMKNGSTGIKNTRTGSTLIARQIWMLSRIGSSGLGRLEIRLS